MHVDARVDEVVEPVDDAVHAAGSVAGETDHVADAFHHDFSGHPLEGRAALEVGEGEALEDRAVGVVLGRCRCHGVVFRSRVDVEPAVVHVDGVHLVRARRWLTDDDVFTRAEVVCLRRIGPTLHAVLGAGVDEAPVDVGVVAVHTARRGDLLDLRGGVENAVVVQVSVAHDLAARTDRDEFAVGREHDLSRGRLLFGDGAHAETRLDVVLPIGKPRAPARTGGVDDRGLVGGATTEREREAGNTGPRECTERRAKHACSSHLAHLAG
jgi:hypothetical protein